MPSADSIRRSHTDRLGAVRAVVVTVDSAVAPERRRRSDAERPDGGVEHAPDGCYDTSANPRLPLHGPPRYLLAVSDTLDLDEGAAGALPESIVRFTEIPNGTELLSRLERLVAEA